MVAVIYYNVTSNVGLFWYMTSSTITNGTVFTIEGQSSTNQLILRNLWIPLGASSDIYLSVSTGADSTVAVASGATSSYNSYFWEISSSTLTMSVKNNSNTTTVYAADGVVLRI